jgi:hypothetical protein
MIFWWLNSPQMVFTEFLSVNYAWHFGRRFAPRRVIDAAKAKGKSFK